LGGSAKLGGLAKPRGLAKLGLGGSSNVNFIVVFGELGRRLVVMKTVVAEEMRPPNRRENGYAW
jgi:hypothetical protein